MEVLVMHDDVNHTISCFASDDCLGYVYDFLFQNAYHLSVKEDSKEVLPNGNSVTECSIKTKTKDSHAEFNTLLRQIPKEILQMTGERAVVYGGVRFPLVVKED